MDPTIKNILKSNRMDGSFHTHVSMINPKGRFQFNRQTLEEFWSAYCQYIENDDDAIVGIAEKPQSYLPVLVDVDIKIRDNNQDIGEGLYTDSQLQTVVEVYQSTLRQIVDCTEDELLCVVLEKDMYEETGGDTVFFKHGFHLHFPYIFIHKEAQEMQLIPRVQIALKDLRLFENLGIEDSGSVIDKACCKVSWLLYGSRKSVDKQPYKVTRLYDSSLNNVELEKAFKNYQIFDQKERLIPVRGKVGYYLPRILSILPYGRATKEVRIGLISPLKEKMKRERKSVEGHARMSVEEAINMARKLLPMLADFRASDRNEWMTIGWTLYNISDGHPDGLDLWCEFSARCEESYDENVCIHTWEHMMKKDISIGTLRHYASIDNPEEYKKFKAERAEKYIMASLEGSHNDIAKALYEEYGDEFRCASITNKVWFQFSNHIWEQIEEGVFLREKISGRFVDKYYQAIQKLFDQIRECQSQGDKGKDSMLTGKVKQVQKLIQNLKSATYKSNCMKECVAKGTLVTLSSGLSMKIEDMVENQSVLGWDSAKQGLVKANQLNFLSKGEKECITITLIDGTNITVTPDHKFLFDGEWVEAKNLRVGDCLCVMVKDRISSCIPTYQMKIVDIRDAGRHEVFDINVETLHSFVANGIVVHNCMEVFYDSRFRDKLDMNPYLIGFRNGVYDLQQNAFRPGRPEDFLSKNMPIKYVELSEEEEAVQEVRIFLQKIFPDKSVRNYFLDVSSDLFVGGNHEKIVLFWLGEGDNGKSVTQKFFELMLGKLAIKLNTNIITGKKPSAGAAFADLARSGGGTRLAVLEEPDSDEMINTGTFKHLSGNDSYYARDLFERGKDGREIQPLFKLAVICNRLPRMKSADKAVWNRVRVIPFESTFCRPDTSNPPPAKFEDQLREKRFPMDKGLIKKIPSMIEAFAWILLEHRIKILNQARIEPPKVLAATELYRKQNDTYRQFVEDNIEEDKNGTVHLVEVYNIFREWFRDSMPGNSVPIKNEVEEYLTKLWGIPGQGKKWTGYRIQSVQNKVDNGQDVKVLLKSVTTPLGM